MANVELREEYESLVAGILILNAKVEERLKQLEEKQEEYDTILAKVKENKAAKRQLVELNVGGRSYSSSRDTFLRWEGTYFHGLVCSGYWDPDVDGTYYIDRDPTHFDRIMTALRTGESVDFDGLSQKEAQRLRYEMDYYQLDASRATNLTASTPKWDPNKCSIHLTISEDGRAISHTGRGGIWRNCLLASHPDALNFRVRIHAANHVALGYVKANSFVPDGKDDDPRGWFLYIKAQESCSLPGKYYRLYPGEIEKQSIVTVMFEKTSGVISFEINDRPCEVAIRDVDYGDSHLVPCVGLGLQSSVSLEN